MQKNLYEPRFRFNWNQSGINNKVKAYPMGICVTMAAMVKLFLHIYQPHYFLNASGVNSFWD